MDSKSHLEIITKAKDSLLIVKSIIREELADQELIDQYGMILKGYASLIKIYETPPIKP